MKIMFIVIRNGLIKHSRKKGTAHIHHNDAMHDYYYSATEFY